MECYYTCAATTHLVGFHKLNPGADTVVHLHLLKSSLVECLCTRDDTIKVSVGHVKLDCMKGRLYSRMSFIYNSKIPTLTPFVKPCNILNLAIQNIFYIQLYVESAFTYNLGPTKVSVPYLETFYR